LLMLLQLALMDNARFVSSLLLARHQESF
jgi:hypothetical protein